MPTKIVNKSQDIPQRNKTFFKNMDIHSELAGFPVFGPEVSYAKRVLRDDIRKLYNSLEIESPAIMPQSLLETSGHLSHYKSNMFEVAGVGWLKPMNCPYHISFYNQKARSYKDLPFHISEFGKVFRNETAGAVSQLSRVRQFEQDDNHIFISPELLEVKIAEICNKIRSFYSEYGFSHVKIELSTRGGDEINDAQKWDLSEEILRKICAQFEEFEEKSGEAAFYGPKIDFKVKDGSGRYWQLGTVQLDFFLPERFECKYRDADNKIKAPILIHFATMGSLERFLYVLSESGELPDRLVKSLVKVIPIKESFELQKSLLGALIAYNSGVATFDFEICRDYALPLSERIANSKDFRYYCVVGEREVESGAAKLQKHKS